MCMRVKAWAKGSGRSVGVEGMCELMLVSAYVWEVGLRLCTVDCLHTHTHTHNRIAGYPDTHRYTPGPLYRHTLMCRHVVTLVFRLSVSLSVFLCWGPGWAVAVCWSVQGPCSVGFQCPLECKDSLVSWELPFRG